MLSQWASLAAFLLLICSVHGQVPGATPGARVLGPPEMVFDQKRDQHRCAPPGGHLEYAPDAPARMFRRKDGEVTLISAINSRSYASIGPDPAHLNLSCNVYYFNECGNNRDCRLPECCQPSQWASREWIYSPWIFPQNDTVVALSHNEFHALNTTPETRCNGPDCTNWAVTSHVSFNGGRAWERLRPAPDHLVASSPYRMPPQGVGSVTGNPAMGYWAPSNIAQKDGWYYSLIHTFPHGVQTATTAWGAANPPIARNVSGCTLPGAPCGSANCVIRTRDLTDPRSWRAWGGADRGWNVTFADPYHEDPFAPIDPVEHVCAPVLNLAFPSLLWSTVHQKWLAAGGKDSFNTSSTNPDRRLFDCSEVVYALSDDLVSWSAPYSIYRPECKGSAHGNTYPSLMDPSSPSANFDVVGPKPFVYFVNNLLGRSIQRVPVELW